MTRRIISNTTERHYVEFRVYHTCYITTNGKKFTDEVALKDYLSKRDDLSAKRIPDNATFITLTLERDVNRGETVDEVISRLKGMLKNSTANWQILTAKETEEERNARRKSAGVEVVSELPTTKAENVEVVVPITENGQIHAKVPRIARTAKAA